ncbi:MAG: hypothetical protein VXY28_00540 [Bacteroidota bacterium]|nr:hypothetical protein [Bacteroidota bacterium]
MNKVLSIFLMLYLSYSCSSEPETPSNSNPTVTKEVIKEDIHDYTLGEVMVKWTAFKHASKAQVGGKFNSDSIETSGFNGGTNLIDAIVGTSFKIPTSTTSTGDKTRDYKIVTSFFNTMANTKYITGTISNMDKNGTGNVLLKMNELEIEKNFNWELDKNNFEFYLKTSINVFDWGAQAALDALNEVCLEQHTGPDGINKLWPDVDITVIAAL